MNLFAIALMVLGLTNASGDIVMRRLQSQECGVGYLPLAETMRCQLNGYTCVTGRDGPACCSGRRPETRACVPCDETNLKKPAGSAYTNNGQCGHGCGVGELPLAETMGCAGYGYTCVKGQDGSACCIGRGKETRACIPCDQTALKKPAGTTYNTRGSCSYSDCGAGELPLDETMGCSANGYTCLKGRDGPQCCSGRWKETRLCVPCDETNLKKPAGATYAEKGKCTHSTKFTIGSSTCDGIELTEDGNCVATKGHLYYNQQNCEITVLGDFVLDVKDWDVEYHWFCGYDWLLLPSAGKFCGTNSPHGQSVSAGHKLTWRTDSSYHNLDNYGDKTGWKICAGRSL